MRALVVWCPDWPVIAAEIVDGVPAHAPVAVLRANRVLACSPAARAEGVRRGLRKREAQGRCPQLAVVEHDPGRDARAYEPVVAVVEDLVPGVEVLRPGVCALGARGPARYFGGEAAAAEHLIEQVAQRCGVEVQVGAAEGVFAASLAARAGRLVPPGQTPAFLAGLDIEVLSTALSRGAARDTTGSEWSKTALGRGAAADAAKSGRSEPELVDLLRRLGVRTLGDFVALPAAGVLARFGFAAALAHRLAAGEPDARPLVPRRPPPDLTVTEEFDEPLDRVDAAAFAARALAERLHAGLVRHGLACTRLTITARTVSGEELSRTWRHDGLLTPAAVADRVRWQLDGWLSGTSRRLPVTPSTGITRLYLVPEGVIIHLGLQPGLWGELGEERDRAHRALTRVQGLLGPEAVRIAVLGGGRGQVDQVRLVPFGDERTPTRSPDPPWPGRLPAPAPATVYPDPLPAVVTAADGTPVGVTGRLAVTAPPARVDVAGTGAVEVTGWAGPWPVDERWWAPEQSRRYARCQVLLADGRALLLVLDAGRWAVEAAYD